MQRGVRIERRIEVVVVQAVDHPVGAHRQPLQCRARPADDVVQHAVLIEQVVRGVVRDHEKRMLPGSDNEDANEEDERVGPRVQANPDRHQHGEIVKDGERRPPRRAARRRWTTSRGSALRKSSLNSSPFISLVDAADEDVLHFEVLLEAVLRPFAPQPGLLHAAEGAISVEMMPTLAPTMPVSIASAPGRCARRRGCRSSPRGRTRCCWRADHFLLGLEAGSSGAPVRRFPRTRRASRGDVGEHGGLEEQPAVRHALRGPLSRLCPQRRQRASRPSSPLSSMSGPITTPGSVPAPTLKPFTFSVSLAAKRRRRRPGRRAVRAHAGLAGVAVWRRARPRPASRSASSNTMNGALPPSSSELLDRVGALASARARSRSSR